MARFSGFTEEAVRAIQDRIAQSKKPKEAKGKYVWGAKTEIPKEEVPFEEEVYIDTEMVDKLNQSVSLTESTVSEIDEPLVQPPKVRKPKNKTEASEIKKSVKKAKEKWTNMATNEVIKCCGMYGIDAWKNTTMGVFNPAVAVAKLVQLFKQRSVSVEQIKKAIQSSYRKASGGTGSADILGITNRGQFVGIEIKSKTDELRHDQEMFLLKTHRNGGIAFVVAEEPEKVKFTYSGFTNYIKIMTLDECRQHLFERAKAQQEAEQKKRVTP
jgi:VRR-NUC domain